MHSDRPTDTPRAMGEARLSAVERYCFLRPVMVSAPERAGSPTVLASVLVSDVGRS